MAVDGGRREQQQQQPAGQTGLLSLALELFMRLVHRLAIGLGLPRVPVLAEVAAGLLVEQEQRSACTKACGGKCKVRAPRISDCFEQNLSVCFIGRQLQCCMSGVACAPGGRVGASVDIGSPALSTLVSSASISSLASLQLWMAKKELISKKLLQEPVPPVRCSGGGGATGLKPLDHASGLTKLLMP